MESVNPANITREPWNKGKLVGQKTPFKLKEIWAIRACDLMQLRVRDVCHGQIMAMRALVLQQKTRRPVQFEITEPTREAVLAWIAPFPIEV